MTSGWDFVWSGYTKPRMSDPFLDFARSPKPQTLTSTLISKPGTLNPKLYAQASSQERSAAKKSTLIRRDSAPSVSREV